MLLFAGRISAKSARKPPFGQMPNAQGGEPVLFALAFTIAPHLQPINHRSCFCPFAGI